MGQIVFIVAAIAIIAIGKALNKRMGQALDEAPSPSVSDEYAPQKPQQSVEYEPELEVLTPEPIVTEFTDYKPSDYRFTYEQLEDLSANTGQLNQDVVSTRVVAGKSNLVSSGVLRKFALRDAVIYSEILTPKFKEFK